MNTHYRQLIARLTDIYGPFHVALSDGEAMAASTALASTLRRFYRAAPPGPAVRRRMLRDLPTRERLQAETAGPDLLEALLVRELLSTALRYEAEPQGRASGSLSRRGAGWR